jgi:pimeloyl-ACP methyl ester carboxylesterase
MRFDYQGSGDSFGELEEMAVSDWLDDIALVEREGREISGSRVVHLVGVRAGSLLACKAASVLPAVKRVVVWDPVIDGRDYVRSLSDAQMALCDLHALLDRAQRRAAMCEYAGYVLSERMVADLRSLDARVYSDLAPGMLRVITTSQEPFPIAGVPCDTISYECEWESVSNEPLVPRPVLERLVECLTRP